MEWWEFLTHGPFYPLCPEERVRYAIAAAAPVPASPGDACGSARGSNVSLQSPSPAAGLPAHEGDVHIIKLDLHPQQQQQQQQQQQSPSPQPSPSQGAARANGSERGGLSERPPAPGSEQGSLPLPSPYLRGPTPSGGEGHPGLAMERRMAALQVRVGQGAGVGEGAGEGEGRLCPSR
jgi:hypothetical protein